MFQLSLLLYFGFHMRLRLSRRCIWFGFRPSDFRVERDDLMIGSQGCISFLCQACKLKVQGFTLWSLGQHSDLNVTLLQQEI